MKPFSGFESSERIYKEQMKQNNLSTNSSDSVESVSKSTEATASLNSSKFSSQDNISNKVEAEIPAYVEPILEPLGEPSYTNFKSRDAVRNRSASMTSYEAESPSKETNPKDGQRLESQRERGKTR